MSSVPRRNYHTRARPCRICGGADQDPRGQGKRCAGYLSTDELYEHCSREEHAGSIEQAVTGLYPHRLNGSCKCGTSHGPELPRTGTFGAVEATYDYTEEHGVLAYQVVRRAGKKFSQRRPDGAGGWIGSLEGVRRVPYHLPQLLAADPARTVYLVEGEKDVESLERIGEIATTTSQGAASWRLSSVEAAKALTGRRVVIIRDKDENGAKYARAAQATLKLVSASVTILECPQHKDISDHLAAGGTLAQLVPMPSPSRGAIRLAQEGETRGRFPYGDHVDLGRQLRRKLEEVGDIVFCEGEMWRYSDAGVFSRIDESVESTIVQSFSGEPTPSENGGDRPLKIKLGDVKGAIQLAHHRVTDVKFFGQAPKGIAFANGFIRVTKDGPVIEPHSPAHRARFSYPFPFEKGAAPKKWLKFLYGIFRDDPDREERILLVHEFFGAALIGIATKYDKAIFMQGNGDDGKSTLLDIFRAAMPPDTCSAVPPHKLSGHGSECDYFRASLAGKLVNIVSELPEGDLLESTGFKAVVSGDVVSARVPCKPAFDFPPVAAHIFAANALPTVGDMTEGFWRRVILLAFTRSFLNDPDRDPNIADAIIKEELPAVVAQMVEGAARLLLQGSYTIPSSHAAAMRTWRVNSDPVRQWMGECTAACPAEDGELCSDLYESYKSWSVRCGHKTFAKVNFGRRLTLAEVQGKHTKLGERRALRLRQVGE